MTREETKKALYIIAEMYQNFAVTSAKVDIWHRILEDYPAAVIDNAIAAYIRTDTKGFPPVPGQLIDLITETDNVSEAEAWELASKACRNGLYGYVEEYDKLPPLIQKCIGSPTMLRNMAVMQSNELQTRFKAQFLRDYRTLKEREKQDAKIPKPVLEVLRKNNLLEAK